MPRYGTLTGSAAPTSLIAAAVVFLRSTFAVPTIALSHSAVTGSNGLGQTPVASFRLTAKSAIPIKISVPIPTLTGT